MIVLMALLYIVGGLMFKAVTLEQAFPYFFYLSNFAYMAVSLVAGAVLYFRTVIDLRSLYRPVLPLVGAGFLSFPLLGGKLAGVAFFLLQSGFALFDVYTWLLIAYLSRRHARPAAVCGFGLSIITFSIFSGGLLFDLLGETAGGGLRLADLVMAASACCFLAPLFLPAERETFAGWQSRDDHSAAEPGPGGGGLSPSCPAVLTPREMEVCLLLTKGWNSRSIAEKLNISTNTVKFHTRNIYSKCAVSDRQELLKIFENGAG